jgi:hypothetical protein
MAEPSRFWKSIAPIFVLINVGGFIFALAGGEMMHALTHATVLLVGVAGYSWWRGRGTQGEIASGDSAAAARRLDHLQESLDVIAVEVERIGESQRYARKIIQARIDKSAKGEQ